MEYLGTKRPVVCGCLLQHVMADRQNDGLSTGKSESESDSAKTEGKSAPLKAMSESKARRWTEERLKATWKNLFTNHLWQRMLKNTLATAITIIIALVPAVLPIYGRALYLAPITTVFGHPGRRFGQMAEALVLTIIGTLLGTAWSTLGIYLSSLIYETDSPAAYTIKGIFLVVAVLFHGFLRSHTPRLFIMVLLMLIVCVVSLTGTSVAVTTTMVTTLLYPILTATAVLLIVNLCVFPEFSSSFLGKTTIETLGETIGAVRDAGKYFIFTNMPSEMPKEQENKENEFSDKSTTAAENPIHEARSRASSNSLFSKIMSTVRPRKGAGIEEQQSDDEIRDSPRIKLKSLTDKKAKLRSKLGSCKAAQQECNFELSFSVLPPHDLKAISDNAMRKLVAHTIALIGACESRYALIGDEGDEESAEEPTKNEATGTKTTSEHNDSPEGSSVDASSADEKDNEENEEKKLDKRRKKMKGKSRLQREIEELELVKPRKEIEFGDPELLKALVGRISGPITQLQHKIDKSVDVITSCLAYCYEVPKLPDGSRPPQGVRLEEIDIWADVLTASIAEFDRDSASALEGAATLTNVDSSEVDIMPRMETFLVSSFLLNLRLAALQTHEMLVHSRILVEKRQARHDRRKIYVPRINWRKWLSSGGEEDMLALPSQGRKDARTGMGKESDEKDDSAASSEENLLMRQNDEEAATTKAKAASAPRSVNSDSQFNKRAEKGTAMHRVRNKLANIVEYAHGSDDVLYAVKLTIAVFIVTWPAFVGNWNAWYSLNRGLWAALQLVLITEVAIVSLSIL